ncbi:MAG: FISUMP domain-containing protein [Candidatus Saccharimonadales bacterium]
MDSQTVTQTINLLVGPGVPNTGLGPTQSSPLLPLAIGTTLTLLIACLLTWYFLVHRSRNSHNSHSHSISKLPKLSSRSFSILVLLALTAALLATNLPIVSAAPTLSLGTDQGTIQVTVPQGGGTTTATTTLTSGTANAHGYTLTASLTEPEPGIGIKLTGGDITTSTTLNPGGNPLTLKTTSVASSGDATDVTLTFNIDSTVVSGKKELKLNYAVADNESTTPPAATLQSFTTSQCSALPTYTGSNEEAVITLTDTRGDNQEYQVAKLADGNCWMLNNLKLGSTTSTITLTPSDTNIASNFTLPQLTTAGTADYDNPGAYGPIPGDTGAGQTNYGYLYNWSAATAGESRTSHTETDGDAPYSICPSGWRLPTVGFTEEYDEIEDEYSYIASGDYSNLDISFGGTGQYADSGANIAKWQHDGPFRGVLAGGWDEGFDGQGGFGFLWSRSAYSVDVGSAVNAVFYAGGVGPGGNAPRGYGLAVRCLLQQP